MRPEVDSLLRAALDTCEVGIVLRDVCAPYGEVVRTGIGCSGTRFWFSRPLPAPEFARWYQGAAGSLGGGPH